MVQPFVNAKQEFLVVRHSVLNGNTYNVAAVVDDVLHLQPSLQGRTPIPCLEGDVIQVQETGEVVLTHRNWLPLSKETYRSLRDDQIAVPLEEALEKVATYRQSSPEQRVVLCLEFKKITTISTIQRTIQELQSYGLEAYFDSFFAGKLDAAYHANKAQGVAFPRSLHLVGNIGPWPVHLDDPEHSSNVVTVPYPLSFGHMPLPLIYGAVNSLEILETVACQQDVLGAYVRLQEGKGVRGVLRMFGNSLRNTPKVRRTHLTSYAASF